MFHIGVLTEQKKLIRTVATAAGREKADIVIKNGQIVDVFNLELIRADVAIKDGVFVGIGDFDGKEIIDASNRYICPGFIDGHVHIESAMIAPPEFAKVVLPRGVTTVIADPHEIANVSGVEGIRYMLESSKDLPLHTFFMLPSCVPATDFEHAGATLEAADLHPFLEDERVLGLGEVMNYQAVHNTHAQMIDKLIMTSKKGKMIDGHAAGITPSGINVYKTAGIQTDHECTRAEEVKERLQRGMYVMLREGSAAKDLWTLLDTVNEKNARRCLFATDDKHLDDLLTEGSIDHNVRMTIKKGFDPLLAIQMATLNAAECYALSTKGAIAPGYDADFLILKDLQDLEIECAYTLGKLVVKDGIYQARSHHYNPPYQITNSMNLHDLQEKDLQIHLNSHLAKVIGIIPNSLMTKNKTETVDILHGHFQPSITKDQAKLAVIERHHRTRNVGLGIVKGLGLQSGAVASTTAHDSHNLVVAGMNDTDMITAVNTLRHLKGGMVVVQNGEVISSISLPISGLMANNTYEETYRELNSINQSLTQLGFTHSYNLFLTLSFLALPVIPALKLTDCGLFDVEHFKHIPIEVQT